MADKKNEADDSEAPAPRKRPKLLLFIVIGVLVLVLAAGGGAYFLLKKKPKAADEEGDESLVAEETDKRKNDQPEVPPVFVKLEPFTIKLKPEQQTEAYLQATPELRVLDAQTADKVKLYMPEIRHRVLLIMAGKGPVDLSTPQGVQQLSNEMRGEINLIIDGPKVTKGKTKGKAKPEPNAVQPSDRAGPEESVQAVLFTSFIIQ